MTRTVKIEDDWVIDLIVRNRLNRIEENITHTKQTYMFQ